MEEGGKITGHVTSAGDNQPLANVRIMAFHHDTGEWGSDAETDVQGKYTIQGLPDGDCRVEVNTWEKNILQEYYEETRGWDMASRVTVTAGETTENINMKLDYGYSHEASVMNVHQPDGSFDTYYFFDVYDYEGNLPGDFISVTVKTPGNETVLLEWDSGSNKFFDISDGSPELGVHTFTATATDGQLVSTDYQYVNKTIPIPAGTAMLPAEGTIVAQPELVYFKNLATGISVVNKINLL